MEEHKAVWMSKDCSFMIDGWTDRTLRTLINFLVNSPCGTVFIKSIDASADIKTGKKMVEILEDQLKELDKEIGIENVIQVITDNASNLKYAGEKLERYKLYWTPCAAHCLNLMLKDLAKIVQVRRALSRAMQVTGYIYSHTKVINIMKEFTKREIVRPAKTRFATSYITLQSIHKVKQNLRTMFANDKWKNSSFSKEAKRKVVEKIVFMTSFWNDVHYALKLTTPLIRVLRLVDNGKKPAMGYIYEAMDRVKEALTASFGGETNVDKYNEAFKYIEERWHVQLHRPLHAAGYYLNLAFYYDNQDHIQSDEEVQKGLYDVIAKLVDLQLHDVILKELCSYRNAIGLFGIQLAEDSRKIKSPGFRNTSSQISASLASNGKYVVCASEDSHVYMWRNDAGDSQLQPSRSRGVVSVTQSYEHFHCRDVTVAVPWPGGIMRSHSNGAVSRCNSQDKQNNITNNSNHIVDNSILNTSINPFGDRAAATWPEEKLLTSSNDSSLQSSVDLSNGRIHLHSRLALGMVILTAGRRGQITTFQNFGFPS